MVKTVGARELKTRLGTYLRQVRRGARIVVTDRGEPVAELRPISRAAGSYERRLEELVTLGVLSRASKAPLASFRPGRLRGRPLSVTVMEDRRDRF